MQFLVIDGQGGSLGRGLVAELRRRFPDIPITAIGTNVLATSAMLGAGASAAATGENPVLVACAEAEREDIIIGPIGILSANAFLGEVTPQMAAAVGKSRAHKLLIPSNRCSVTVVGAAELSYNEYITAAAEEAGRLVSGRQTG